MEREMRRSDRQISQEEALALLERAEYGVLSTVDGDGQPYGVPLSHAVLNGNIYFHCAQVGHKLDNLSHNAQASYCVVGATNPVFGEGTFGTEYESAVAFGRVETVEDQQERNTFLLDLCRKYLPEHMEHAQAYVDKAGSRTAVYKLVVERLSGKARRPKP